MSAALITQFYAAFGARDHAAMARCYAPDAHFSDPVVPDLPDAQVAAMWRMRCERAKDLRDGRIARHEDRFDLYAWSRQALGVPGMLLGWAPLVQNRIRRQAGAALARAIAAGPMPDLLPHPAEAR